MGWPRISGNEMNAMVECQNSLLKTRADCSLMLKKLKR